MAQQLDVGKQVRFVPKRRMAALVARSPIMGRQLGLRASRAAERAKALARAEAYDTGAYHDSIGSEQGELGGVQAAVVKADDWKAGLIELGTSETPARAILRRGCEAAGLVARGRRGGE